MAEQEVIRYDTCGPEAVRADLLETFPYEYAGRRIELEIETEEFTSVCPWSGLPDFGKVTITYVPNEKCIELKSLKLYMHSYRNVGMYYEHISNKLLEDLVAACDPLEMTLVGEFNVRGGFKSIAKVSYKREK